MLAKKNLLKIDSLREFKNSYRLEFRRNCKDLNKMTASDLSNDWIKLKEVYIKTCKRMEEDFIWC